MAATELVVERAVRGSDPLHRLDVGFTDQTIAVAGRSFVHRRDKPPHCRRHEGRGAEPDRPEHLPPMHIFLPKVYGEGDALSLIRRKL
ncbi:hypothetical protein Cci01nite_70510 [Catellatospora citrea]|uniref:Uncharacterized protein n=1 Tax=Catellatospora citrea TaxID=53366 RepID=A0A8J3KFF3_9ACTN|nr:hypothetical protein Cci01nite_70510 [Catellatospora citrea]